MIKAKIIFVVKSTILSTMLVVCTKFTWDNVLNLELKHFNYFIYFLNQLKTTVLVEFSHYPDPFIGQTIHEKVIRFRTLTEYQCSASMQL